MGATTSGRNEQSSNSSINQSSNSQSNAPNAPNSPNPTSNDIDENNNENHFIEIGEDIYENKSDNIDINDFQPSHAENDDDEKHEMVEDKLLMNHYRSVHSIQINQDRIYNVNEEIKKIMTIKKWDDLTQCDILVSDIHSITTSLKNLGDVARFSVLNSKPTLLSNLLTLLICKGYIKRCRISIWNTIRHVIKEGIIPTPKDIALIYYEFRRKDSFDTDSMFVCNEHIDVTRNRIREFLQFTFPNNHNEYCSLPLLELMYDAQNTTEIHCNVLNGAITMDQLTVNELTIFIQKYSIFTINYNYVYQFDDVDGTDQTKEMMISDEMTNHEMMNLIMNKHEIYIYIPLINCDGETDMHLGTLISWLWILRILYHERRLMLFQYIQKLQITEISDIILDIILEYVHNDCYLRFKEKYIDDTFFIIAMRYLVHFISYLSVDEDNWKQLIIDKIWNTLNIEQLNMIQNDIVINNGKQEIWNILKMENNELYKQQCKNIYNIQFNPQKSMPFRPIII